MSYRRSIPACLTYLACGACLACGAEPPTASTAPGPAERAAGAERPVPAGDGLVVSGLRGTLSQGEIQRALEPRLLKFSRCAERRSSAVEWLSGRVALSFIIADDGSVAQVFPVASSIGDRETERCILEVARSTRFPAPHGGPAEFEWPLEIPLDAEIREPLAWDPASVGAALTDQAQTTVEHCGGGAFSITAYVDAEGHVVAAGGAVAVGDAEPKLDCITGAVKAWTFPSPGSYAAKISFNVP